MRHPRRRDLSFPLAWPKEVQQLLHQAPSLASVHPRTVIAKAECQAAGTNLRFAVTNLPVTSDVQAQQRYDDYVQRGTSAQRLDELKNGLHSDRLSCHRFCANFWRLGLHAAAYNLLNWVHDDPQVPADASTPSAAVAHPVRRPTALFLERS